MTKQIIVQDQPLMTTARKDQILRSHQKLKVEFVLQVNRMHHVKELRMDLITNMELIRHQILVHQGLQPRR